MKSTKTYYSSQARNTQTNARVNTFSHASNNIFNKQFQKIILILTTNDVNNEKNQVNTLFFKAPVI